VALRRDLFSQVGPPELARMEQSQLSDLAQMYGVGIPDRAGGARAIVLAGDFVADLLSLPTEEVDAVDGVDGVGRARTREASTASTASTRAPGADACAPCSEGNTCADACGRGDAGVDAGVDTD